MTRVGLIRVVDGAQRLVDWAAGKLSRPGRDGP